LKNRAKNRNSKSTNKSVDNLDERLKQKCYNAELVRFTELKSGLKGIAIGMEDLFLVVDYDYTRIAVKLLDIYDFIYPLTGWFFIKKPSSLRKNNETSPIRQILREKYGKRWKIILERIIAELENYIEIMNEEKPKFWRCPRCKLNYPNDLAEKLSFTCSRCNVKLEVRRENSGV